MMKPLLFAAAMTLALPALAHGDAHATPKKAYDAQRVEDKAFGREGDPKRVSRTIKLAMSDQMRFTPAALTVRRGETVRLVVHNGGKQLHELVLGTSAELQAHAELMRKFPGMEHDEPHMTHVQPGRDGSIVWQFTQAGEFSFACLIPGHFEAGMVGKVVVR